MNAIQLEFDVEEDLKYLIDKNFLRIENIRKGIFQKHSMVCKDIQKLKEEICNLNNQMEIIKKYLEDICDLKIPTLIEC